MEKYYPGKSFEEQHYQWCEDNGYFKPSDSNKPYTISLPPPNVTGILHMGHAFQSTLIDILIRYHRMAGYSTSWIPGTDHAGIATQLVVERQLNAKGITIDSLERDEFIKKVWEWKQTSGGKILNQFKRLGASIDWSKNTFTMDKEYSASVYSAFTTLYQDNLIYRGTRLVNWDSHLQTAVSDLEVIHTQEQGYLYYINYSLVNSERYISIATTRPETMFGDTAIAVHPDDARFNNLIGTNAIIPLTDKAIPIIGDEMVDSTFGSGAVKITPAHDFNDYQTMQRHSLSILSILSDDGTLNQEVPLEFRNLDTITARKKITEMLKDNQSLTDIKDHAINVPRGERSRVIIEPYLTKQWFLDLTSEHGYKSLVEPALQAITSKELEIIPRQWNSNYCSWLNNIQDWCISRQIMWGHRIPIWYDHTGKEYLGTSIEEVRKTYTLDQGMELHQETDVLDTWFSSALWPMSNQGWPQKKLDHRTFPNSTLVTGFDIIFFWVARMVMFGKYFGKSVPFKQVYIHGLVRDSEGNKMSKSKGNILDPLDIIDGIGLDDLLEKRTASILQKNTKNSIIKATKKDFPNGISAYGTDALRFSFASMSNSGRDIKFDLKRIEGYRNFCNKLWNAAKFLSINIDTSIKNSKQNNVRTDTILTTWMLSRLQAALTQYHDGLTAYKFNVMADALYHLTWDDYCDWYLELIKPTIKNNQQLQETSLSIFRIIISALHPIIPSTTQAIWEKLSPQQQPLLATQIQKYNDEPISNKPNRPNNNFQQFQQTVIAIRNCYENWQLSHSSAYTVSIIAPQDEDRCFLQDCQEYYAILLKNITIQFLSATNQELQQYPLTTNVGNIEILFHHTLTSTETKDIMQKIKKKIAVHEKILSNINKRLNNKDFIAKASKEIIAINKENLSSNAQSLEVLCKQKNRLKNLTSI